MEELREKANSYAEENVINVLKEAFVKVYADGYRDGYKDCKEDLLVNLNTNKTEFVDLGLSSRTLWSSSYETIGIERLYLPYDKAKEMNIPLFATTLASSRWKNIEQINLAGKHAEEKVEGTLFWAQNWRKGGLYERRNQLLKEYAFYNQQYCGCEYSMNVLDRKDKE